MGPRNQSSTTPQPTILHCKCCGQCNVATTPLSQSNVKTKPTFDQTLIQPSTQPSNQPSTNPEPPSSPTPPLPTTFPPILHQSSTNPQPFLNQPSTNPRPTHDQPSNNPPLPQPTSQPLLPSPRPPPLRSPRLRVGSWLRSTRARGACLRWTPLPLHSSQPVRWKQERRSRRRRRRNKKGGEGEDFAPQRPRARSLATEL